MCALLLARMHRVRTTRVHARTRMVGLLIVGLPLRGTSAVALDVPKKGTIFYNNAPDAAKARMHTDVQTRTPARPHARTHACTHARHVPRTGA